MQTITCDIAVFKLLEKSDQVSFDPTKNVVFEFLHEDFWCLLIFCADGPTKGCKLFLLKHSVLLQEAEKLLLPELLAIPEADGYVVLKNEALLIVEKLISERKNESLFFDAH